mmetsp:Transcript_12466/g.38012  ORF Transcript_12466/g.38012 Transcript_12466/m.38012 type:complete len:196 (-) Transcript_12466:640-1227(-)|eukprot:CAMPEP_0198730834 /NCGR_PEP_ID=MMETSP1475-20131203/26565_1 /TAXON_ID= ORGANISM="Unidentified sp., Strain CCMP1999" /NCGR_SAMPLE_ID=MMETSP1475 /ASSEMBLY_ACC=CAM_ASM_001111 /LENGTH=195 /DNA_ID=CAMNT_0044493699 /DNA_START=309 /DNA_END=896 /DNA_ORIENTATION=-
MEPPSLAEDLRGSRPESSVQGHAGEFFIPYLGVEESRPENDEKPPQEVDNPLLSIEPTREELELAPKYNKPPERKGESSEQRLLPTIDVMQISDSEVVAEEEATTARMQNIQMPKEPSQAPESVNHQKQEAAKVANTVPARPEKVEVVVNTAVVNQVEAAERKLEDARVDSKKGVTPQVNRTTEKSARRKFLCCG